MHDEKFLVPISDEGHRVLELYKNDAKTASQLMAALSEDEQISLVTRQAVKDPKGAQDVLFLLEDEKSEKVVENLGDRTLFRIMKSQSSTHIGVLSLVKPNRVQSILDLDQELFSTKGVTDPDSAYHWMISFLEQDEAEFARLLTSLDIKVVASAFQDKILVPTGASSEQLEEEEVSSFHADFLVKLDRGELKPDDLAVTDEETLDILTRIHLVNEQYFNELVSLMLREEDLKTRTAEDAMDRIHSKIGDISEHTEEAEDMFVPLEE
jgi:hypothetical protein